MGLNYVSSTPPNFGLMKVQICYVHQQKLELIDLFVPLGASIEQALQLFLDTCPTAREEIDFSGEGIAVFGKKKKLQDVLVEGDRIEICAALIAHPMDARRLRAKREHKGGKM